MDTIIATIREDAAEACFEFAMQNIKPEAFVKKAFKYVEIHQFHEESATNLVLDEAVTLLEILKSLENLEETQEQIRKEIASQNIENLQKILDE